MSKFVKEAKQTMVKNSPGILVGLGITGFVGAGVLAVKATPKALRLLDEAENEKGADLTKKEIVKVAWKPYIPAIVTATTSAACIIGANSIHAKRNAALATAYKISETALLEYRDKVKETIGEVGEREIREKIAKDKVEKKPPVKSEVIVTEKGNTLCYDAISGRYFKSDMIAIEKAINVINKNLISYDYVPLNDLYDELGLPNVRLGNELGWNLCKDGLVEVSFSTQLSEEGVPCIVLDYLVAPRYDYSNLM